VSERERNGERVWKNGMEQERRAEREIVEQERSAERDESGAQSVQS